MKTSITASQAGPRVYAPVLPPAARRHACRSTRWIAVVNELAKKNVSTRPMMPVARRTSSADEKAPLAVSNAAPPMPN